MLTDSKKGAMQITAMGIIAVIAVVAGGYWLLAPSDAPGNTGATTTTATCSNFDHDVSLSNVPSSGVTKQSDGNTHELKLTDSYNLSNTFTFDVKTQVLDQCRNQEGNFLERVIEYQAEGVSFSNADDSSDSTTYYTIDYIDDEDKYNVTVDGTKFATVETVQDTAKRGSSATATVKVDFNQEADLNKLVKDDYDEAEAFDLGLLTNGQEYGGVSINWMQTP